MQDRPAHSWHNGGMLADHRTRTRAITVAVTLLLVGIAATGFTIALFPERSLLLSIWVGVSSGFVVGLPLVLWILFGIETPLGRALRRLPLAVYLALNGIVMSAVLLFGNYLAYLLIWPYDGPFLADPNLLSSMIFSTAVVITVSVAIELRRLIGPGVFGAVLIGRYRYPRAERRLFLLLDVVGSTGLAERLGPERFLAFLDRWIHLLTEPLLASGGRIYRYVGDEVILTWEWKDDAATRALAFAVAASAAVGAETSRWQRDFGQVPEMRAALHGGPVMAGEIGDLKREITFLGDTLNTAARIAGEVRKHDGLLLTSVEAIEAARLPSGLVRRDLGPVALRGKAEPVPLVLLVSDN